MLNSQSTSRLARLALLRARVARCAAEEERPRAPDLFLLPRALFATDAAAAQAASPAPPDDHHQQPQYREYSFALTPEHRRVTVVANANANANAANANADTRTTPILVSTSPDPERIVIRAPTCQTWAVELGPHGPEARESDGTTTTPSSSPPPPPPLQVALPPRFCGLDVTSSGGDVTVAGSGVQEADVRIVVVAPSEASTTTTTPKITATRLRCGELVLDAGRFGAVAAKEVAASRLEVRAGRGVELGRVSALEALVEAGERLEVGALYGRAAVLRLGGGGGGGGGDGSTTPTTTLPVLRVNQLSCGVDDEDGNNAKAGATLEAWPSPKTPIHVRVDGALAGRATVASGGGPVALAAVQAAGGLRELVIDSGGGDVEVSLDTGGVNVGGRGARGGGGGGGRGGGGAASASASATATLRLQAAADLHVDPSLGLSGSSSSSEVPVFGAAARDSSISIDAGGRGRVALKARSWMDGVMARAKEAAAAARGWERAA